MWVSLMLSLFATLTVLELPLVRDETPWYIFLQLGRVRCGICVLLNNDLEAVFYVRVAGQMIENLHMGISCRFLCRQGVFCRCVHLISCFMWC